uniref:Uncharacterized protein n=3 Tax=viral metagenome TaxID=1070528 RepID=A0A6M3XP96_9ZZZZ
MMNKSKTAAKLTVKKYRPDEVFRRTPSGKYHPIGYEWTGFPMDGIWQVRNGKRNNSVLLTEEEVAPLHALQYRTHRDNLLRWIQEMIRTNNDRYSLNDLATWTCDYFAEAAGEPKEAA